MEALRLPVGQFQAEASDPHRVLWRAGTVELEEYTGDVAYLGLTVGEYKRRLRVVHELPVLLYVYRAPVTKGRSVGKTAWAKIGHCATTRRPSGTGRGWRPDPRRGGYG
ncbi:hypothetical protein [Kitasatospora sp. NPDC058046]|uniref:hypothetical protein n=1 Tax=Kitasatospora sp. NPDC058046 TaxID=3346312 RepID=UPI0036DC48F0